MKKKTKQLLILTISTIVGMVGVSLIFATVKTKSYFTLIIGIILLILGTIGLNRSVK